MQRLQKRGRLPTPTGGGTQSTEQSEGPETQVVQLNKEKPEVTIEQRMMEKIICTTHLENMERKKRDYHVHCYQAQCRKIDVCLLTLEPEVKEGGHHNRPSTLKSIFHPIPSSINPPPP